MGDSRLAHVAVMDAFSAIYDAPSPMFAPNANPPDSIDDEIDPVFSISMISTGGTMETFSHMVMKGVETWMMPNDHTLICPHSLAGFVSRGVFEAFGSLLLAFQVSSYQKSFSEVEDKLKGRWEDVAENSFKKMGREIYKSARREVLEKVASIADVTVAWKIAKEFAQNVQFPISEKGFPVTALPLLLSAGNDWETSTTRVFPHDRSLAVRLIASVRDSLRDEASFKRLWAVATENARRSPLKTVQTIPEPTFEVSSRLAISEGAKKTLTTFYKWVNDMVVVHGSIAGEQSIQNLQQKISNIRVAPLSQVNRAIENLKKEIT